MIQNWQEYKTLFQFGKFVKYCDYYWSNWYWQYTYYENNWYLYYFNDIFLQKYNSKFDINLVFFESSPGGMPFPHPNYIFDSNRANKNVDGRSDRYLVNISKTILKIAPSKTNTIRGILEDLSKNNILIIDIYPCHGLKISSKERARYFNQFLSTYSTIKLEDIKNKLEQFEGASPNISQNIYCSKELYEAGFKSYKKGLLNISNPIFIQIKTK